jgi:hypothetical protein
MKLLQFYIFNIRSGPRFDCCGGFYVDPEPAAMTKVVAAGYLFWFLVFNKSGRIKKG